MTEIQLCKCGCQPLLEVRSFGTFGTFGTFFGVVCNNCEFYGDRATTLKKAIENWDNRLQSDTQLQ